MAENKNAVSFDELALFKALQDLYNANTFQKKGESDLAGAVRYDAAQVLTEEQKAQARANIGAGTPDEGGSGGTVEGAVLYNAEQALDEDDKARARANIGTTDGTWENMPDKPFGEGGSTLIEMPSDISGRTTISSQSISGLGGVAFTFVKVADKLNSASDIVGSPVSAVANGATIDFTVDESHIKAGDNGFVILYVDELNYIVLPACLNVNVAGTVTVPTVENLGEDLTFEEAEEGLYFLYMEGIGQTNSIAVTEIKKIDKKYLPDDINVELPEGLVTTDENGLIPASLLPSYVDDAVEGKLVNGVFNTVDDSYITPESGKIYVDINTGNTYRWSGSQYMQLNPPEITFATSDDIRALFNTN